jgi:hypothetical protein
MIKSVSVHFTSEQDVEISATARLPLPTEACLENEDTDENRRQLVAQVDDVLARLLPLLVPSREQS